MTAFPPPFARWLLHRLAGASHESLVGDIEEQFARGRSAWWYRRQAAATLIALIRADARRRPTVAVRSAVLTGVLVPAWVESTWILYLWLSEHWVYAWTGHSMLLAEWWIPFGGGLCLLWCAASAAVARLAVRWSGDGAALATAVSVVVQLPLTLWWSSNVWLRQPSWWHNPLRYSIPMTVWMLIVMIGMPLAAGFGGVGAAGSPPSLPAR
jgi:hypothetical protein